MNSGISANSLFHFTPRSYNLANILKHGFYVRYCLEDFRSLLKKVTLTEFVEGNAVALPMVSFCDIPLSQIKYHSNTYGNYGIGLSKEWAIRNKISPLIYTYPNALTSELFDSITKYVEKVGAKDYESNPDEDVFEHYVKVADDIQDFIKFIKPYNGKVWRNDHWSEEEITFYNEREWRYIPTAEFFKQHKIKGKYSLDIYKQPKRKRAMNLTLQKKIKLKFEPTDVKYIIVSNDSEIPNMVETVREIFADRTTYNQDSIH